MALPLVKVASLTDRYGVFVVGATVTVSLVLSALGGVPGMDRAGVMLTASGVCGGSAEKLSAVTVSVPLGSAGPLAPVTVSTWPVMASAPDPTGSVRDRVVAPGFAPAASSMLPPALASKSTEAVPGSEPSLLGLQ